MIENAKVSSPKFSDLLAFTIFAQNVCIGQGKCSPKCPLKDPYYKCKIIAKPTWLSGLNSYMYSKISAAYPLFRRLKDKCMLYRCSECDLYEQLKEGYRDCIYFRYVCSIRHIINNNVGSWRHLR